MAKKTPHGYDWEGVPSEGLTPVREGDNYFHIRADGQPAYSQRYSQVGAFSDGLASACKDMVRFFHIKTNGSPAYQRFFTRVGPFINGRAFVQTPQGKEIHIRPDGTEIA